MTFTISETTGMHPRSHQSLGAEPYGAGYIIGMERLLRAIQELSLARELADVQKIVRVVARELTGCDGATFVLNDGGNFCHYADEDAITPLWKGQRFPQEICISGWVMRNRKPVVISDIYADARIPHEAYRPTFVKSLAMVPIRSLDPVGAIGNYWARPHQPSATDLRLLQALADSTSVAMENIGVYADLEQRVRDRTAELTQANIEIQKLAVTDGLTGLYNRRGFYEHAGRALHRGGRVLLAFLDVDGLKRVNDELGHAAGDAMLTDIAQILRANFRATDIIARMGGDEFCMLLVDAPIDGTTLRDVVLRRIDDFNATTPRCYHLSASIGFISETVDDPHHLDRLLIEADRRMYEDKAARRMARV